MSEAVMKTSEGEITFELFDEDAPKTVSNFKELAGQGFYDGLIFHRIIPDFMIQGGCPEGTGTGGPGYTFEDEINDHKVVRGALAMANAGPNTNGSQFFIVTADECPWLDGKHTVFGQVTAGQDVVERIGTTADRRPRPPGRADRHRDRELRRLGHELAARQRRAVARPRHVALVALDEVDARCAASTRAGERASATPRAGAAPRGDLDRRHAARCPRRSARACSSGARSPVVVPRRGWADRARRTSSPQPPSPRLRWRSST